MANHLPTLIGPWLEAFITSDWLSFRTHRLAAFRCLQSVRLRPQILWSALQFWDSDVHVFRFGDNELCLTVEEFQAYLQGFAFNVIVVPPYQKSMSKLLKTSLNITTGAAENLLSGGQINIRHLMEWVGSGIHWPNNDIWRQSPSVAVVAARQTQTDRSSRSELAPLTQANAPEGDAVSGDDHRGMD
ncbi:hypothetical protein RHMOL_Rhmol09G0101300 [Rhododendron molle]|uniref:Uncharacterized protein n=1 Tax=Rhododendron molle TaxID=49168 RepID=A0ACC0MBS4_RHOML|nr:hypothetical protein RHMOL_Rhmol09G0101300 [Rhododendron molle]